MTNDEGALAPASPAAHLSPAQGSPHALPVPAPPVRQIIVDPTRLQPHEAAGYLMLAPDSWRLLKEQCTELVRAGALHSSIDTAGKAMIIGMKAIEMGVPLTAAWSGMRIIDGEVTILGKLGLRLIQQRALPLGGTCSRIPVPPGEDKQRAGWLMGRPGEDPQEYWFTIEDARTAGLLRMKTRKNEWIDTPAWSKYPDRMLPWRALAKGAAYTFADVLQGCLLNEEMNHKDPEFIVTQEVAHHGENPGPGPTFQDGAAPRREIGKDHPELLKVKELVNTSVSGYLRLYPTHPDASDMSTAAWYKLLRRDRWQHLTDRCVKGDAPTQDEARLMQEILCDEITRLKEEIRNQELGAAHEAEKAKADAGREETQSTDPPP